MDEQNEVRLFNTLVLDPRCITIDGKIKIIPDAFAHFGTIPPLVPYKQLPELKDTNVWLEIDQATRKQIVNHYLFMQRKGLCEGEFAAYAKETFFKGEPRGVEVPHDHQWRSERMLQVVFPLCDDAFWSAPPVLAPNPNRDDYKWDLRPDCAYWLSLRGKDPNYSLLVGCSCFVYRDWITCPYLTIEFKRDDWEPNLTTTLVAAAGALALYNRHQLRVRAIESDVNKCSQNIHQTHRLTSIRHYALTFTGSMYTVWLLQPAAPSSDRLPPVWNGCHISRLTHGDCTDGHGLGRLVDWINEIHRWGLTGHADGCQADIRRIFYANGVGSVKVK